MRTNLLNDLSNVVKKGAGLACSWSQVGRMSGEGAIEHPLSTHSAPFRTRWKPAGEKGSTRVWKHVAMIFAVLVMSMANVGMARGAETVLFSSFTNTTASNYFKSYTVDGKTVSVATSGSISSSSGDYYCGAMGSTPSNNNGNYVELTVTGATIKTVSVLITGNGENKTCQPALLGWEGAIASNTTADYVLVPASQVISNKGLSNAQWHQFDVHGNDLTRVRIYRAVKGVDVAGESTSKTTYGNAQTLQFYGIRVELESGSSTYTVTYNGNGNTSGSVPVDSDSPYEKDATVTVLGNSGTLAKTGFIFNGWNTSDDGSGAHYDADDTFTMGTANVTLYAEWAYPATGTVTVTYALSGSTTTGTVTGVSTINSLSSSFTTSTLSISSTKSGYTGDIVGTPSSFSSTAYLDVQFTIADGYQFNPSSITVQANPLNNTGALMAKVEILDGTTTVASNELSCAKSTDNTVTFASGAFTGKNFKGTTHLRIYFWGPASDKKFYVKSPLTITGTVAEEASSCTAPNHVDVAATSEAGNYGWRYTIGETMKLTAKAYSTAGTSSEITSGLTYQWKKKTGESTWKSLTDGVDATDGGTFSGTTSANLQVSGCTSSNAGTYKCEVSTGAGCTTTSNEYWVRIFTLDGNYSGEDWIKNPIVWTDEYNGTVTLTNINANSTYKFKVTDNDSHWYGKNTAIYKDQTNYWAYRNDGTDIELHTGIVSGTYTISVDVYHANDVSNPYCTLSSVNYPKRDIYMELCSDWNQASAQFAIYYFRNADSDNDKGWTDLMTTHTCNSSVMHADDVPSWADRYIFVRLNSDATVGTWDKKWNQTVNVTPDASKDYYHTMSGTDDSYSGTWGTIPTYTISFAANGGSGSMSSISSIACDADQQITANAFEKTGYTFANWTANVDVTVNDATVSAGSAIANSATIQNIRGNIALTAQWTEDKHSVTVAAGSNGTVSPSSVSNIGITTASGDITATANTGYHFTNWTLPSGTSAASTYSESSNPIRINATADGKTITANFSANTPTITLDDQDATNTPTGSVVATYGSAMPSITTLPTKTGYTFGGFYSDVAGGGTKYYNADGSSAKNSDLASATTLYALWTQSVTIDDNGGSANGSVDVTYKGTAGTPSVPTYAGHTVDLGYYAESSCTNKVMALDGTLQTSVTDGSSVVWTNSSSKWAHAGSSTLYAHWKCNTPEISCSSNTITISVPSGATVYYTTTTDGSTPADPTSSSTAYNPSSKPTISADTKIKAIAIQSGCTNSAIASASLTYVAPGPSYTAPTSALDVSAQTSVTAAGLITANNATQSYYLSTNTDTLLLIPSDIYYNIGNGKKNTWAKFDGSSSTSAANWTCPAGSVSFKGRTWWKSGGNINTLEVRSDRSLNIRVKGCKTVSVLSSANTADTKYFIMEAYEYDDGYKSSDPDVSANNKSTSVTETSLSLNSSKEYVVVLRGNTEDKNKVYEIKFIAPSSGYTVSIAANPAGYGTVSSSSVTSVASGTTLSTSTNTLSVGATDVTASATSATAEYTYAFSNWTKSDGTALPSTVTEDLSVYANFTRTAKNYTLAWNTNGGSDLSGSYTSGSTAYGASITAPNDPTLSNYAFDGWKTNNDGTGTTAGASMPAANTTYYAAWKQTVTLTTGAQGSGSNQTPHVYKNGTAVSSFTAHTASGYALQGYYTAGSGGTKVLNADGTFAGTAVTDYITSSKWSRTGAAPTLYAQWVAAEDCHTLKYVWKVTGKFCDDQSTSVSDTVRFPANASNLYFTVSGTGNTVSKGSSYNLGNTQNNYFLLTAKTGYQIKSICFYGKVQDSSVGYTTDGSSWSPLASTGTGSDKYYTFDDIDASAFGIKLTAASPEGVWIRNMVIEVCAAGGTTYKVTYDDNGKTGGSVPTDATNYSYGGTVTVKGNTGSLEKTNYTFAGWTTNDDGTGSNYVADNTFSITANTTLYAKWTQAVTFDANTANHGSTGGSATAVWNATGLTGITHATPASGYKLTGYYTAATSGTKVLNSDGSFAGTSITGYISDGKWIQNTTSTPTLYAQYESAGALTWNLIVNSDTTALSTSSKTSAFTEISNANMTDAALTGLTYTKSKKSSLTGKISTPASEDASKYVSVSFQVAAGYKFTPSSIKVKVQPISADQYVKLELKDNAGTPNSITYTTASKQAKGSISTVEMTNGSSVEFTGTVTLKIFCYGTAYDTDGYRLGTPITIEGEIEEACGTMPSYASMSYTTTTFAPNADASGSPITIVGGDNIDTYQWKYNTVNDRTSGTNCGTNNASLTPLTDASATTDGTRYYWCEMTNDACGITIKSPAVAITVAAAKSNATVTWTNPASTPNYGGGGYTIKATVDQTGWDGNAADLVITAPAGIRIYNVSSGTDGSSRKYVQADFDVQTSFDRSTYASNIPFTVSAAATATYNAISNDHNTAYSACAGAGEGSSYIIRVRKAYTKGGPGNNYYYWDNTDGWISSPSPNSSIGSAKASSTMALKFDSVSNTNAEAVYVRTYHDNIKKIRIYADFRANNMTVSNVYKHNDFYTANSKYAVDYSVVYNGDEENSDLGDAAQGYVDITLSDVMMSANDILLVKFNTSRVRPLGAVITESSSGSLATALSFASATVNKSQGDASFIQTATRDAAATTSLGAITYSSNNTSVATVNATTGEVTILGAGAATIKATLAASGCYQKAEATYTVNVAAVACTDVAGTVTTEDLGCGIRLTLSGYTEGATIAWYKDGAAITPAETGTTYTATSAGSYYAVTHNDCDKASNTVVLADKVVSAERIVEQWYIKNGRVTPDIALWSVGEGTSLSSVAWSPDNATGLTAADFYLQDGVIYLKGKSPSSNDSDADIEYTLTLTVTNGCSPTEMSDASKKVKLIHQKNTDKHVLAFVVTGTEKGGFTEGITAAQTTSVELYNTIAANFDVVATNIYSTDDEKKLKEYYSQFDILCVTDYPNTGTKGVNKKSYVDALGALVDIRPILTMEAFVSKLDNWKAKGISGTPKSPTTRQYTMLLQCKDHEIFSGTELTKVGEGDETMYRVSMVDNTKEDYATLDATYGATLPHKEKESKSGAGDGEYNYGGKPALQGFTFDATMADDGLLPLGRIDDGAGNDLEVGIERQTKMEARLMVLGINSYAMERLTDDGQTVVINALKYLLKKNSEDIADCSNTFVGGDDEEDESTRYNWNVDSHWSGNAVPDRTQKVRIVAPCVIPSGEKPHVTGVIIAPIGKYNHGANTADGSLTIAAGGALIVDGKVEAATAPLYTETRATSAEDLTIQTSSTAQGALIFDNSDGDTHAVVEMWNPSYWEVVDGKKKKYWSYVAVPIQEADIPNFFWYGFTYLYDETSGWIKKSDGTSLYPFQGIGASLQTGHMETFYGPLATTESQDITLTYTADKGQGMNLIGNSWTAPIQIANFEEDDFGDAAAEVWVFNTGHTNDGQGDGTTTTAGQWNTIPINMAGAPGYEGLKVIPAMQAFEVNTTTETTLHLDYDRLVRAGRENLNEPMRAPRRGSAAKQIEATMRVRVSGELTHTDVYLLKDARFSDAFDNGWDGHYLFGDDRSASLYAVSETEGAMAFLAQPEIDGTILGFAPSRYGNDYTFTFYYLGEEEYYLNDIKLQKSTLISEEESYLFTFEEGDTNRFYISKTPFNAPSVATGTENTGDGVKARKVIYNNHVYIIRAGKVYGIDGTLVVPNMEQK